MTLALVCVFRLRADAASYYFSASDGDDTRTSTQAQSPATPWKTLPKLLAYYSSLAPGDNVLFKRGDTFIGTLSTHSGSAGSPINYGAYGTGANPVISGFIPLSSWTLSSGNIYYATLDVPRLQIVTLDNIVKGMGRYPNTGFLQYTASSGNASISGPTVGDLPFDPTGGEAVVKKWRYILDRHTITSRAANTLNISTSADFGSNKSNVPTNSNGYFIQSHLSTLDQEGEWYYDNAANRFYMHFGRGTPKGGTVQVGSVDSTIAANGKSYMTFTNLQLTGANVHGINVEYADHVDIKSCTFTKIGGDAIKCLQGGGYITVSGCTMTDCLSGGVSCEVGTNNVTVTNCSISNVHQIAGMGKSGDGVGTGISLFGNAVTATDNVIRNVGYCGIAFYDGNNVSILRNKIDGYCNVKDDGGGIYSYGLTSQAFTNRIIQNNTILNGIGNLEGIGAYTSYQNYGSAHAIYLDGHTSQLTVTSNVVAHSAGSGIFLNNNPSNTITNNVVYDCFHGLMMLNLNGGIRNVTFTGNIIVAKTTGQYVINVETYIAPSDISNFGTFNNNIYARPIDDHATIRIDNRQGGGVVITNMSLATWKSTYALDTASKKAFASVGNTRDLRFEYNATSSPVNIALDRKYCDIMGKPFSRTLRLAPYNAKVLLNSMAELPP